MSFPRLLVTINNMDYRLKNKNVLITGSSRGIGAETARVFNKYGANVILHGKTESSELKALSNELGAKCIFCDVANHQEVERQVRSLGVAIDVLVNNAGVSRSKKFEDLTYEDWKEVFESNLFGAVNFSKAVIPEMKNSGEGRIINISSIRGYNSNTGSSAYSASKAAIINLTASMASQYAPDILVNCVAPGFTKTEMTEETWSPRIEKQVEGIPLKRMANSKEIAEVIVFLASKKSNYITGQTILVDGGITING